MPDNSESSPEKRTEATGQDGPGRPPSEPAAATPSAGPPPAGQSGDASDRPGFRHSARRFLREVTRAPGPGLIHPALIPGIGVERTQYQFGTNPAVFSVAGLAIVGVILWAIAAPDNIAAVGDAALAWVTAHFGWMYGVLTIAIFGFIIVLGYGRAGGVRLGADDEKPEFTTFSWVAMLFSAGMGIGLLFYGPYEPLVYYANPPTGFDVDPFTVDAAQKSLAQVALHWGPLAWSFYALVGGAIAYNSYRRGRPPLISALFEPIFGERTRGWIGDAIDIFAIIVTLFGTAVSLGIGSLQIGQGLEQVTGVGPYSDRFLVGVMAILTCCFILSAVSGVDRGIRILSNTNMVIAGLLALFLLVVGPSQFLFNFYPAAILSFFQNLGTMLVRNPNQGPETAAFMGSWTTYYWAWWVTWAPFVGLFIAKISRGRTLREFVTVVVIVPAVVCVTWFVIFGGTAISMNLDGLGMNPDSPPAQLLFELLRNLPLAKLTSILAMLSIIVFFVTSADSASIVMSSMSQRGQPQPSSRVTITWGVLLGVTAASLLLAGGANALGGLQSIMVVSSLPFAFVVMGMIVAWAKDLRTDPYILRSRYAQAAIAQGVRLGIANHGDDFVFGANEVATDEGAGGWIDSTDPKLVAWYLDVAEPDEIVTAEDIRRTLRPGKIQPKGPPRPDLTASGDKATIARRRLRREGGEEK